MPWPKFSLDPRSEPEPIVFERGDHVYQWCSVGGVPYVYQHHGIVMHVEFVDDDPDDDGPMTQNITIADFSNFLPESSNNNQQSSSEKNNNNSKKNSKHQGSLASSVGSLIGGGGQVTGGILRVYTTNSKDCPWHKVEYGVPLWKTAVQRSGSCTTLEANDTSEAVLNRVGFLLRHQARRERNDTFRSSLLPEYNVLYCNCECIAMWCKTGRFGTLQGASLLASATWGYTAGGTMALRQAVVAEETLLSNSSMLGFLGSSAGRAVGGLAASGGTTTAAAAAAAPTTTSSSMAFGATVSSAQPWVLGAITAYGAVTAGTLLIAKSKWKATTEKLNEALREETVRAQQGHTVVS